MFPPKRETNAEDLPTVEHGGAVFVCADRWRDVWDYEKNRRDEEGEEVVVHLWPDDGEKFWDQWFNGRLQKANYSKDFTLTRGKGLLLQAVEH